MIGPLLLPPAEPYTPIAEIAIGLSVILAILAVVRLVDFRRSGGKDSARRSSLVSVLLLLTASVAFAAVALFTWRADAILNARSGGICGVGNFERGPSGECVPVPTGP